MCMMQKPVVHALKYYYPPGYVAINNCAYFLAKEIIFV